MAYLIAVDGGGTSCRAVIAAPGGTRLGEGHAGSANVATDLEEARDNIVRAATAAAGQAGLPAEEITRCDAVLGLAGVNIGDNPRRIAAILPFRASQVETDARIALQGALEDDDGAVAVLGTGSVFISRSRGRIRTIGGWGLEVGDFCGGARLGRTLLEQVLMAHDGLRAASDLARDVLARFGGSPGAVVEFAQAARPVDLAGFAPMLFDYAGRGDGIACDIVTDAVRDLEATLQALAGAGDLPICLAGGLAPAYARRLSGDMKRRERQPRGNALSGALSMAVAAFGRSEGGARSHG